MLDKGEQSTFNYFGRLIRLRSVYVRPGWVVVIELDNGRKILPLSEILAATIAYLMGYQSSMQGLFDRNGVDVGLGVANIASTMYS